MIGKCAGADDHGFGWRGAAGGPVEIARETFDDCEQGVVAVEDTHNFRPPRDF